MRILNDVGEADYFHYTRISYTFQLNECIISNNNIRKTFIVVQM